MKNLKIYDGGSAKLKSYNPYDGGTAEFSGKSHEKGGIKMSYKGNAAEVEGGETAVKTEDGGLMIMGNMKIPNTNTKFKDASKAIAKKESTYQRILDLGSDLVDNHNTTTKWDRLKFQTGYTMMDGASKGQKDLAKKKADLSLLQEVMLDKAGELGIDPIAFSEGKLKKAKHGLKLEGGGEPKPSMAKRHNNPGNMKYAPWMKKYGAVPGEKGADGGNFAKFPSTDNALLAMQALLKSKTYNGLTTEAAIKKWTNNTPYNIPLGDLAGKKVGELNKEQFNKLFNVITQGEDGKPYNFPDVGNDTPKTANPTTPQMVSNPLKKGYISTVFGNPDSSMKTSTTQGVPISNDEYTFNTNQKKAPIYRTPFDPMQLAGEAFALAANRQEYVPAQSYDPQLFQQYNVSFQDRLNQNQSTFNAAKRVASYNPALLGAITAQNYDANSQVLADEFRTNQGISNEITNKNISLLNDAQLKNLQIADTQMVRQSQARSNTKQVIQEALNSVSAKFLQHKAVNSELGFYQDMFNYRPTFDDKGHYAGLDYQGPDQNFGAIPQGTGSINSEFERKTVEKKLPGGVKETTSTPAPIDQKLKTQEWLRNMSPNKMFRLRN